MSKQDFESVEAIIRAIPAIEVKKPTIPIDAFLQEAENLFFVASEDQIPLTAAGLNWEEHGASLQVKTGALRYTQSVWVTQRYSQKEAQKEWDEKSGEAYELKEDLISDFAFAFRKRSDLQSRLNEINKGTGHADMIQDLSDLSTLGKLAADELAAINFDPAQLTIAAEMADSLGQLLARANGSTNEHSEIKTNRDKAFTYLKESFDEIRVTGKYVFRKDKDRLRAYSLSYKR